MNLKGEWKIHCYVCLEEKIGPPHGTTCLECLSHGYKYCKTCNSVKDIREFYKRPDSNGFMSSCSDCYKSRRSAANKTREDIEAFREAKNAASRLCKTSKYAEDAEYREREIERCHERRNTMSGTYTSEEWLESVRNFSYSCAYCGSKSNLTVDHIIPISKNGANKQYNVIPACSTCNSSKGAREVVEWYTSKAFYLEDRLIAIHKWFIEKQRVR